MAQCKLSAGEFIQSVLSPNVAVLASEDAEHVCRKNNLTFVQLIQPFCRLTSEAHVRDPSNIPHIIRNFRVVVRDVHQAPYQATVAKKLLNESVTNVYPSVTDTPATVSVGHYDLQLSPNTPWFESYRERFFEVSYTSEHEFLKHYLACMFVVSSSHPDPMEQFNRLTQHQSQQQHQQPNKYPKWFYPNICRYYVLLHDVIEGEESKAEAVYQSMKALYSANSCHLLQINSRSKSIPGSPTISSSTTVNVPDPWSQFLTRHQSSAVPDTQVNGGIMPVQRGNVETLQSLQRGSIESATEAIEETSVSDHPLAMPGGMANAVNSDFIGRLDGDIMSNKTETKVTEHGACLTMSDHDRLRIFMHEFIVRGLISWAEKQLRILNEQVSSKKTKGFLGRASKWFGGNSSKPIGGDTGTTVVYTQEAPEMQLRRLGDLAFMFQLYDLAYQTYHSAKRDFNKDNAWLHCAGALEMTSVSMFLQGVGSQRQYEYMETAIATYLNTCKNLQFATRATLLGTEVLKARGMYSDAASHFIKVTSEESDLRSALLLEQSAHCFINKRIPMVRKYAFQMILTGHRFNKAGQRQHALRSYLQALQVYQGKGWSLAEDHINFTVGRQSFNLKQFENAVSALRQPLSQESSQSPTQQAAFLKEYLFVIKQLLSQAPQKDNSLCQLPLPLIDGNQTKVLLAPSPIHATGNTMGASSVTFDSNEDDNTMWYRLEELCVQATNSTRGLFRPSTQCYTDSTVNTASPTAVVTEPVTVQVMLINPLQIQLLMCDVMLLWRFVPHIENEVNQESPLVDITNEQHISVKNNISEEIVHTDKISEVHLEPHEHRKVELRLVPHKAGDLHLTGLAYQIGTTSIPPSQTNLENPNSKANVLYVKGKQMIKVQGQRLNMSKKEMTAKMYGPDRRLDLSVVPSAPQLQVVFENFPKTLSCGQVQRVNVMLRNTSQSKLGNIMVASPTPQYFIFGEANDLDLNNSNDLDLQQGSSVDPKSEFDASNVYPLLTPSDTEHRCKCSDNNTGVRRATRQQYSCVTKLTVAGIEPGQCVTVPMYVIGASRMGEHHLDLLFYYEPVEACQLDYRVLRHRATINILSGLSIKAVATRGIADDTNSAIVSLEIDNLSQAQVGATSQCIYSILQISSASKSWCLHHLSTKSNTDVKVHRSQTTQVVLKACKCGQVSDEITKDSEIFSDVVFDQHHINSTVAPCQDFHYKDTNCAPFHLEEPINDNIYQVHKEPVVDPFEGLERTTQLGITLIVLWKGSTAGYDGTVHTIVGQSHVTIVTLETETSSGPLTKVHKEQGPIALIHRQLSLEDPQPDPLLLSQVLKVNMDYRQAITHDFKGPKRLCVHPIKVTLQNTSLMDVIAIIQANKRKSSSSGDGVTSSASASFVFTGQVGRKFTIPGDTDITVYIKACFWQSGVYYLNSLKILAGSETTGDYVQQRFIAPYAITVADSNSATVSV